METMREHVVDYTAGAYRAAASVGWYTRIFLSPACRCTEKSSHMAPYSWFFTAVIRASVGRRTLCSLRLLRIRLYSNTTDPLTKNL